MTEKNNIIIIIHYSNPCPGVCLAQNSALESSPYSEVYPRVRVCTILPSCRVLLKPIWPPPQSLLRPLSFCLPGVSPISVYAPTPASAPAPVFLSNPRLPTLTLSTETYILAMANQGYYKGTDPTYRVIHMEERKSDAANSLFLPFLVQFMITNICLQ